MLLVSGETVKRTVSFRVSIDNDGDLAIQWLSINTESSGKYGTAVKIIKEQVEIVLEDSQVPNPASCTMWIGTGTIDKYKALAQSFETKSVVLSGFRE